MFHVKHLGTSGGVTRLVARWGGGSEGGTTEPASVPDGRRERGVLRAEFPARRPVEPASVPACPAVRWARGVLRAEFPARRPVEPASVPACPAVRWARSFTGGVSSTTPRRAGLCAGLPRWRRPRGGSAELSSGVPLRRPQSRPLCRLAAATRATGKTVLERHPRQAGFQNCRTQTVPWPETGLDLVGAWFEWIRRVEAASRHRRRLYGTMRPTGWNGNPTQT